MITKKSFLISLCLTLFIGSRAQDTDSPCLNADRLHTKLIEEIKEENKSTKLQWLIWSGILGKTLQERQKFIKKFLQLPPQEQKAKIENWLKKESRKQNLKECDRLLRLMHTKRTDDAFIQELVNLGNKLSQTPNNFKDELLCDACTAIFEEENPNVVQCLEEDKKFRHEFETKLYFAQLRAKHKNELEELEQIALTEFESLADYLHYDNWYGGRRAH